MKDSRGFTLIEVLMALALMALLTSVVYASLGPAGEGFIQLKDSRDRLEKSQWLGRQLRLDMSYISNTGDSKLKPFRVSSDARGSGAFDELWLLTRESGQPSLSHVHYFIDEASGELVRESLMAWSRSSVEPLRWQLGEVESFDVELLDSQGKWVQRWEMGSDFKWPRALRITIRNSRGERSWDFPVQIGSIPSFGQAQP